MAGKSSTRETVRIAELKADLKNYSPGKTIRSKEKRLRNPPMKTRIGIFGAPGVGKSALVNSLYYVTRIEEGWNSVAPEGFVEMESTTMMRDAHDLTEHLVVCDNRGMADFSQKFMGEVEYQLGGFRKDSEPVVWNKSRIERLSAYLNSLRTSGSTNKLQEIHCAAIVVSGKNLLVKASDLAVLVQTIKRITGVPPIFIITHKKSECDSVSYFKSGLHKLGVQYVYEIENYTQKDHFFDVEKHLDLLEILNQCTLLADKVLQYAETQESACILL